MHNKAGVLRSNLSQLWLPLHAVRIPLSIPMPNDWDPECESHVYRDLDVELQGLNESTIAYGVWDWRPGRMKYFWGNRNELKHVYKMTLDQYKKFDPSVISDKVKQHMHAIAETVQERKQTMTQSKTLYFGGVPTTIVTNFRPLRVQFPDGEQHTLILGASTPKLESDLSEDDKRARLATEVLTYVQSKITIFGGESSQWGSLFENPEARNFYNSLLSAEGASKRNKWKLDDLIRTCVFSSEDEEKGMLDRIKSTGLQDAPWEFECQKRQPGSDALLWHRVSVIPSMNPITSAFSLVVQEYDISPLKRVQSDLEAQQQAQDLFFASVSHELRSPLNGIIGLASALQADRSCSPAIREVLTVIQTSGQRLVSLVNDILDAASSKRGAMVVKQEAVELGPVVDDVLSVLDPLRRRGVALSSQVSPSFPPLLADGGRLNQILTNLVSNAIKFTARGWIQVRAWLAPGASNVARVEVADTGEGIAEDKLEQIWGGFQQADVKTTQKHGGTGLGLALVKTLVEAQGGTVAVTSSQALGSSGSCFSFTLPLYVPGSPSSSSASSTRRQTATHLATSPFASPRRESAIPEERGSGEEEEEEEEEDDVAEMMKVQLKRVEEERERRRGREEELAGRVKVLEEAAEQRARDKAEMEQLLKEAQVHAVKMKEEIERMRGEVSRMRKEKMQLGGEVECLQRRVDEQPLQVRAVMDREWGDVGNGERAGRCDGGGVRGPLCREGEHLKGLHVERDGRVWRNGAEPHGAVCWDEAAAFCQGGRQSDAKLDTGRNFCGENVRSAPKQWGGGAENTLSGRTGRGSEEGMGEAERLVWRRLVEHEAVARAGAERRARLSEELSWRRQSEAAGVFSRIAGVEW